jgi:hypothetical protein
MPDPLMVKLEKQLTGLKEKARTLCERLRWQLSSELSWDGPLRTDVEALEEAIK